jgi:hypothetical protein
MSWQQHDAAKRKAELMRLIQIGGAGWHAYVLDQAQKLAKSQPEFHATLPAAIETNIGPKGAASARKALAWFAGKGAG